MYTVVHLYYSLEIGKILVWNDYIKRNCKGLTDMLSLYFGLMIYIVLIKINGKNKIILKNY